MKAILSAIAASLFLVTNTGAASFGSDTGSAPAGWDKASAVSHSDSGPVVVPHDGEDDGKDEESE